MFNFAEENNGIITTKQLKDLGVKRWTLTRLEELEKIFNVQRGVFVNENEYADDFFIRTLFKRG